MATYTLPVSAQGTGLLTLTAATVDTVTFTAAHGWLEVINPATSTADVWYTLDNSTPTVGGTNCFYLPPGSVDRRQPVKVSGQDGKAIVKLISAGTPTVRVQVG